MANSDRTLLFHTIMPLTSLYNSNNNINKITLKKKGRETNFAKLEGIIKRLASNF